MSGKEKKGKNDMKEVCVITGGGSGIGYETARIMASRYHVIICGRTKQKLDKAVEQLKEEGLQVDAEVCDVGDRNSVLNLVKSAKQAGEIKVVVHAAGMSPHMDDAFQIMKANAIGTIFINSEFAPVMSEGSCIVDISSMAGYLLPSILIPSKRTYRYSNTDLSVFLKKIMRLIHMMPRKYQSDLAYGISKNFCSWRAKTDAIKYGENGIRVISVSPGNFETPMGQLESKEGAAYLAYCGIKRFGDPKEIAELIAFIAGPKPAYLTGVDILMDGGCVTGKKYM